MIHGSLCVALPGLTLGDQCRCIHQPCQRYVSGSLEEDRSSWRGLSESHGLPGGKTGNLVLVDLHVLSADCCRHVDLLHLSCCVEEITKGSYDTTSGTADHSPSIASHRNGLPEHGVCLSRPRLAIAEHAGVEAIQCRADRSTAGLLIDLLLRALVIEDPCKDEWSDTHSWLIHGDARGCRDGQHSRALALRSFAKLLLPSFGSRCCDASRTRHGHGPQALRVRSICAFFFTLNLFSISVLLIIIRLLFGAGSFPSVDDASESASTSRPKPFSLENCLNDLWVQVTTKLADEFLYLLIFKLVLLSSVSCLLSPLSSPLCDALGKLNLWLQHVYFKP
mmetsp:Transcript_54628/g.97490  ORF Transcript_54628/g.97490 Transcript_54628/m.97490 type:complete len:336 (+) Transcript_54628:673-1680(+)